MTTLDAALKLKEDYQKLLAKEIQRWEREIKLQELSLAPSAQERRERDEFSPLMPKARDVERQLGAREIREEISELQEKVELVVPNLARLLNELNTYEISDAQGIINYEPEERMLNYQDANEPQQQFGAVWDNERWVARSGNLTAEKAAEILNLVSRHLEILAEAQRERQKNREKQPEIEFEL